MGSIQRPQGEKEESNVQYPALTQKWKNRRFDHILIYPPSFENGAQHCAVGLQGEKE